VLVFSLDFLRNCKELVDWYGRTYPFLSNPLALPFAYDKAVDALNMGVKVRVAGEAGRATATNMMCHLRAISLILFTGSFT